MQINLAMKNLEKRVLFFDPTGIPRRGAVMREMSAAKNRSIDRMCIMGYVLSRATNAQKKSKGKALASIKNNTVTDEVIFAYTRMCVRSAEVGKQAWNFLLKSSHAGQARIGAAEFFANAAVGAISIFFIALCAYYGLIRA